MTDSPEVQEALRAVIEYCRFSQAMAEEGVGAAAAGLARGYEDIADRLTDRLARPAAALPDAVQAVYNRGYVKGRRDYAAETERAEAGTPVWQWGVQWADGVISYESEEVARHEQAYPTRPEQVNPVLVRRRAYVTDWMPVPVAPLGASQGDERERR